MNAIDRVMCAYLRNHTLTEEQTLRVRAELSSFIEELRLDKFVTSELLVGSSRLAGK
jgi:hypothetical protein